MSEFNVSINNLFERAFGLNRGEPFQVEDKNFGEIRKETPFDDVPILPLQEGTEFVNVREVINANLPDGRTLFMPMRLGGSGDNSLVLPNEPTVFITGQKRIVSTPLVGSTRRGSVKELIRVEDYSITIRGIAINYNSTQIYPEDQVKAIHDLYLRNESLQVESALTNLFGIYRLVIKSITFPEMMGVQHAQAYELQCESDEDFFLTID